MRISPLQSFVEALAAFVREKGKKTAVGVSPSRMK